MILFTWNLRQTERAFRLALTHLAQAGDAIAVLQELPPIADSTEKARRQAASLTSSRVQCLGVKGSAQSPGRLGFFASLGVSVVGGIDSDPNERMGMAVLKSQTWSELRLVGIHAVDRRSVATEFARDVWGMLMRQQIESFWKPKLPLVVMGDFNADPYHPEVSSRLGMFAVRDRVETQQEWESALLGGPMRALYNPMWRLLAEDPARPGGTLVLNSQHQGIRWRLCDQILVSSELIPGVGTAQILPELDRTPLLTSQGNPDGKISDHLPVQLTVN